MGTPPFSRPGPLSSACWCLSGSAAHETSSEHLRAPFPCARGPPPAWGHLKSGPASPPQSQPCGLCCGPRWRLDQGGLAVCAPSPPHRLLWLQWWKWGSFCQAMDPASLHFSPSSSGMSVAEDQLQHPAFQCKGPSLSTSIPTVFWQTDRQTDIPEVCTRNPKGIFCTSPNSTHCPRLGHTSCSRQPALSRPTPQPVNLITAGCFSGVAAGSLVSSDALRLMGSRMFFSSLYLLPCQPRAAGPAGAGHLEIGQW